MTTSPRVPVAPGGALQAGALYAAITQVPAIPPIPPIPAHTSMSMTAFVIAAATLLLFPFVVALAIRIMRRPAAPAPALAPQWQGGPERLERLEQAVDTIALEVERISEGQRFLTKLLTDKSAAPVAVDRALVAGDEAAARNAAAPGGHHAVPGS